MRLALFVLFLIIVSCKSSNINVGDKFIYENEFLSREFNFINDTTCEFKQNYRCEDLDAKYKFFKTIYVYNIIDTVIFTSDNKKENLKLLKFKKINYKKFNFSDVKFIEIPTQNSKCYFLNKESRELLTNNITYDTILKIRRKMTIYESTNRILDLDAFTLLLKSKNKIKFHNEVYKFQNFP